MIDDDRAKQLPPVLRLSGRAVVAAMLLFGVAATGAMWTYWTLHTAPFRPLQDALAAEFPGSSPRVDGGQHKMHKGTPRILNVVMRVKFDPIRDVRQNEAVFDRVEKLAERFIDLRTYDEMHLTLFHGVPEKDIREKELVRSLKAAPR